MQRLLGRLRGGHEGKAGVVNSMKQRGKSDSGFPRIKPFSYPVGRVCFTFYFTVRGGVADSLSTFRMTQQEGQEESDQQEDRNEWFVNWNRHG